MTPDPDDAGRPLVAAECLVREATTVSRLRVGGVEVIDPARPLVLRPGDRLRLIVDRPDPGRPIDPK